MKNNKRGAVGIGSIVIILLVAAALFTGGFYIVKQTTVPETALEEIEVTGDCETAPTLRFSILDAVNPGTAVVTTGNRTIVNGELYGPASIPSVLAFNDVGTTLYGLGSYLNTTVDWGPLKCGVNPISAQIYATDDGTLKIFNDDGLVLHDTTAAPASTRNQTNSATTIQNEVRITSVSDQSLGDLICVVEAHNTTQVDDMLLSDGAHTTVEKIPNTDYHAAESVNVGSLIKTFKITAGDYFTDGKTDSYTLSTEPESGQTMGTTDLNMSFTCYTLQWYVDVDGTFKYGMEDVDGGAEFEDDFDYDWGVI